MNRAEFTDARKTPTTKRPKVKETQTGLTFTFIDSHLVVEKDGEVVEMCRWSHKGRPLTNSSLIEVARTWMKDTGYFSEAVMNDVPVKEDRTEEFRKLAERLMSDLAFLRSAYETVTCNHPDDDERILHLGHTEASIRRAFKIIYGREMEQ